MFTTYNVHILMHSDHLILTLYTLSQNPHAGHPTNPRLSGKTESALTEWKHLWAVRQSGWRHCHWIPLEYRRSLRNRVWLENYGVVHDGLLQWPRLEWLTSHVNHGRMIYLKNRLPYVFPSGRDTTSSTLVSKASGSVDWQWKESKNWSQCSRLKL